MFDHLKNAPPRISDLQGTERLDALYRRANSSTARFIEMTKEPQVAGRLDRLWRAIGGARG